VAVVVTALIGVALTRIMTVQSRFMSTQEGRSAARSVSRTATGIIFSDLRMVEATQGVVAATRKSVTLRVPYAMGLVCGTSTGATTLALLPIDSATISEGGFSGYAWRGTNGAYTYVTSGASLIQSGTASMCVSTALIDTVPGGNIWRVTPAVPAGAGTPVMLYRNITYAFQNSVLEAGRIGLWRTVASAGVTDELVAPFDTSAAFGFFVDGSATPLVNPPALTSIRGLELQLTALNSRNANATNTPADQTPLRTGVFFKNR
jgi:hypothetical protein